MALSDYLAAVGLPQYLGEEEPAYPPSTSVEHLLAASNGIAASLTDEEIVKLYTYKVPVIGTDGREETGSIEQEPFKITDIYNIPFDIEALRTTHKDTTEWLWRLNKLVGQLQQHTGVQSIGIYRTVTLKDFDGLVKLAFYGEESRAIFPLSTEFTEISVISWVGSTGKAKLISDRNAYKGAYYAVSDKQRSELCLPIVGAEGEVVGVINVESHEVGETSLPKVVLPFVRACVDLGNTSFGTVL